MAGKNPIPPERLRSINDPAERGAEASRYIDFAKSRIDEAREIRDEAIRTLNAGGMSQPKIAEAVGVSVGTVRLVLK